MLKHGCFHQAAIQMCGFLCTIAQARLGAMKQGSEAFGMLADLRDAFHSLLERELQEIASQRAEGGEQLLVVRHASHWQCDQRRKTNTLSLVIEVREAQAKDHVGTV